MVEPTTSRDPDLTEPVTRGWLRLSRGELIVLSVSFCLIAFVAVPNFLGALYELRGRECSSRLELIYNILFDIAKERGTEPGEEICQTFDVNVRLDQMQTDLSPNLRMKVGAEPDCPDVGNFVVDLHLGPDGRPVAPKCTLGDHPKCIKKGLHRFVPPLLDESVAVTGHALSP